MTPPDPDPASPGPPPGDPAAAHDPRVPASEDAVDPDRTQVHEVPGPPPRPVSSDLGHPPSAPDRSRAASTGTTSPPAGDGPNDRGPVSHPDDLADLDGDIEDLPDTGGTVETPVEAALRRRRAGRARDALVSPWSAARARRLRLGALVLILVGPVLGSLFALVIIPSGSADQVPAIPEEPALLSVTATVRNFDASAGQATALLVPGAPDGPDVDDSLFDGAVLDEDITLGVNDATGDTIRVLPAGQPPGALTVTVPLTDSRVTRYPLDSYQAIILVQARRGGADGETVPVALTVTTNDPLFTASAEDVMASSAASVVTLKVERRWTGIGWAVFFVVLCWMLAISAASVGWTTIVHGIPAPVWAWAFLIGILFALPPLRDSLPGNPPGGSLVDFAAFYWAVGIVAVTLVALAGSWNVRVRRWPSHPESPRPPQEPSL